MKVTNIRETKDNPAILEIVLTATRTEVEEARFHSNVDCQIVEGQGIAHLLEEAARRLDESDCGVDWSRACQLKDLAREIRREQAVEELANRHADAAGEVWAKRFEKQGGQA